MPLSRRSLLALPALAVASGQPPEPFPVPPANPATTPGTLPSSPSKFIEVAEVPASPLLPGASGPDFAARKWSLSYQYDEDERRLRLRDFAFPSPAFGIAIGGLFRDGMYFKGVALITTDGGKSWNLSNLGNGPISMFALDEANIWVVDDGRLIFTSDGGKKWERRKYPADTVARVCFLTPTKGFAFGRGKSVFSTADGGRSWKRLELDKILNVKEENTNFYWMDFPTPDNGILVGSARLREPWQASLPDWMIPESVLRRRALPGTLVTLVTADGGKTWSSNRTSAFGDPTRLRTRGLSGLSLFHYADNFNWPSEVYYLDLRTGKSRELFRKKELKITDFALLDGGGVLLAGVEPPGELRSSALTGKVRALYSPNGADWYDMKVDYRSEGAVAYLARDPNSNFWIATNEGMILKLNP